MARTDAATGRQDKTDRLGVVVVLVFVVVCQVVGIRVLFPASWDEGLSNEDKVSVLGTELGIGSCPR